MRMIDADALLAAYDAEHKGKPGRARRLIENAPTIEPKRGRWVFNDKTGLFDCADCGISSHYQYNFCPHCGAKMEGVEE